MNVLDYGLASIMISTTLAGSQIGGYILLIFPSIFIQIFLTLLLAYLTYLTTMKALQLDKKEKEAKAKTTEQNTSHDNLGISDEYSDQSQLENMIYSLNTERNSEIEFDPNDPKKLNIHGKVF